MERPQVFISWSGSTSRRVGDALREWLTMFFNHLNVWISTEDLSKGTQWFSVILAELKKSSFGIVCVTPDNLSNPWLLFEAGAIANLSQSRVFTFLHHVTPAEVRQPLGLFNHTEANRDDIERLLRSINSVIGEAKLDEDRIGPAFEALWPAFESKLKDIVPTKNTNRKEETPVAQDQNVILAELLELARDTSQQISAWSNHPEFVENTLEHRDQEADEKRFAYPILNALDAVGHPGFQITVPNSTRGDIRIAFDDGFVGVIPYVDAKMVLDLYGNDFTTCGRLLWKLIDRKRRHRHTNDGPSKPPANAK